MRKVKVAATQMKCSWDVEANLKRAEEIVREAAKDGANIILLQELFETPYFCQRQDFNYMKLATNVEENKAITHFKAIAKELKVVLPISFFERAGNTAFNSVAVINADGSILGIYRKTHIPDGLPYAEKFYFTPGDTGFQVWDTTYGKIGVGICWDQWFPEAARCMVLEGAEILLYPTAIGNEPTLERDSKLHWQHCMQGHAAANMVPVVASNRIGEEEDGTRMTFYGSSFIADQNGNVVKEAGTEKQSILINEFDLDEIAQERREWGIFRDRRPEMYHTILTHGK
jgi:N-carbamoylputrescine amidase